MTIEQLLPLLTQWTIILIALVTLVDFLRYRDRTRFDVLLLFADFALIILLQWLQDRLLVTQPWLGDLTAVLLLAHPYLLLRLVQHLRPVPPPLHGAGLAGMLLFWLAVTLLPSPLPGPVTLLIVLYFAGLELYSAAALVRGALNTSGVTRWRLWLAAAGSGLLGAMVLIAGIASVLPGEENGLQLFQQLLAFAAMLCYFLGFAPPYWLRRAWQLSELHSFLLRSSGTTLNGRIESVLLNLCTAAQRTVGGVAAAVALWDEENGRLAMRAVNDLASSSILDLQNPHLERAWRSRRPVMLDVPRDIQPGLELLLASSVSTILVVPVATPERSLGLLLVFLHFPPLFPSDDLEMLTLFADHTATALGYSALLAEQVDLIEQLRRYNHRLETLHAIDQSILSAESPKRVAEITLEQMVGLVPFQRVSVMLFDRERDEVEVIAIAGEDHRGPGPGERLLLQDFPSLEQFSNGREVVYEQDITALPSCPPIYKRLLNGNARSLVFVPLVFEEKLAGLLAFSSREPAAFQFEHQEIARELGSQLSIAIHQAQLRTELQRYTAELEKRVAERTVELSAAQERLRFLLSATPAVIYSSQVDEGAGATFISDNVTDQLGYEAREFLEDPTFWKKHVHPEDAQAAAIRLIEGAKRERNVFEYRFRHRDGSYRWMRDEYRLVYDREGKPSERVGYWIDITHRKQAEEAIAQLNRDLAQHASQLKAANNELEAFAYSVSHDLRAPLRAIDGFSRILVQKYGDGLPDDARRYLDLVRANTQQMGQLIDDLLSFSRLSRQELNKQTVNPAGVARLVMRDLLAAQEDRQVEVIIGDLPPCEADPSLLKQVFVNLLSNALKFTSKREKARIEVGCEMQSGEAVYFVRDNGVGFDMKYADKLFGVFQRLHRVDEFEGTGVGLATVQRIIHRHGGRIWADAAVGQGATFYFTLTETSKDH